MGDSGPGPEHSNPYNTSTAAAQAYVQNLPAMLQATTGQIAPTGTAIQGANNTLDPQSQQLQNQLFGQYAPQLYNIGNQLTGTTLSGGISNASNNIAGQGSQLLNQAISADQTSNPQYYANRQQASDQLGNLLGSINLGGLTGSETAQVERSNAQQDAQRGILNSPSQTATVSNAMNFGTALQNKQGLLSNAINTATSFLPASKSGVDSFGIASGQATNSTNPGATNFLGTQNASTQGLATIGSVGNALANTTGTAATQAAATDAGFPSGLQDANSTMSGVGSL